MAEDDNVGAELARLRGLGAWMRDVGAVELDLGDVRIKLAPKPPAAPGRAQSANAEEARLEAETQREVDSADDAERAYYNYWRRITRSSGAAIPPYPGASSRKGAQ